MKYELNFQYRDEGEERPGDDTQPFKIEADTALLIPNIGDSILLNGGGSTITGKVLTRHFAYHEGPNLCSVVIVYTDISDEEFGKHLKE